MLCGDAANYLYYMWRDANGNITGQQKVKDSDGNDIKQGTRYSIPQLYDWNGDGLSDLLVGAAANGYFGAGHPLQGRDKPGQIWLYLNTGSEGSPEFTFEKVIHSENGDTLNAPAYFSFAMGDLDNDTLPDIVTAGYFKDSSDSTGLFRFWKNIGTKEEPKFADPEFMKKENGDLFDYPGYTRMQILDYDNDGIQDILYNGDTEGKLVSHLWVSYGVPQEVSTQNPTISKQNGMKPLLSQENRRFSVTPSLTGVVTGRIYSFSGKEVQRFQLTDLQRSFDCSKLSPGVYTVKLKNGNNWFLSKIAIR